MPTYLDNPLSTTSPYNSTTAPPQPNYYTTNDSYVCEVWRRRPVAGANEECLFDTRYFGRTIITEWGLVCEKIYLTG
jgi:hypothetical protein